MARVPPSVQSGAAIHFWLDNNPLTETDLRRHPAGARLHPGTGRAWRSLLGEPASRAIAVTGQAIAVTGPWTPL
jgi:hypothetical protein